MPRPSRLEKPRRFTVVLGQRHSNALRAMAEYEDVTESDIIRRLIGDAAQKMMEGWENGN